VVSGLFGKLDADVHGWPSAFPSCVRHDLREILVLISPVIISCLVNSAIKVANFEDGHFGYKKFGAVGEFPEADSDEAISRG
jgi:hypothetical protein